MEAMPPNGNRIQLEETQGGVLKETIYTYDKNDRLLTEEIGQELIEYDYDNNGNMIGKTGLYQTFDALNRMTYYEKGDMNVTYTYYADDMRQSKEVNGMDVIDHVWVKGNIALDLEHVNGSSYYNVVSSYIHGHQLIESDYGWYQYNAHGDLVGLVVVPLAFGNVYTILNAEGLKKCLHGFRRADSKNEKAKYFDYNFVDWKYNFGERVHGGAGSRKIIETSDCT